MVRRDAWIGGRSLGWQALLGLVAFLLLTVGAVAVGTLVAADLLGRLSAVVADAAIVDWR